MLIFKQPRVLPPGKRAERLFCTPCTESCLFLSFFPSALPQNCSLANLGTVFGAWHLNAPPHRWAGGRQTQHSINNLQRLAAALGLKHVSCKTYAHNERQGNNNAKLKLDNQQNGGTHHPRQQQVVFRCGMAGSHNGAAGPSAAPWPTLQLLTPSHCARCLCCCRCCCCRWRSPLQLPLCAS